MNGMGPRAGEPGTGWWEASSREEPPNECRVPGPECSVDHPSWTPRVHRLCPAKGGKESPGASSNVPRDVVEQPFPAQ